MKKEDLKTGMLVQYRNGNVAIVINDVLVRDERWICIDSFNEELIYDNGSGIDIVKVSKVLRESCLMPKYWTSRILNENLLWERKDDVNELTIEEIEKLTGLNNIKIVKNKQHELPTGSKIT